MKKNSFKLIGQALENFKEYVSFWKLNIHRFIIEYMGLQLATFQQVSVYLMDRPNYKKIYTFVWFASRGLGKTFLTMVYCVAKCILYPNITIKVASATFGQAKMFVEKIYEIQEGRPNIKNEIKDIKTSKSDVKITFHNGSSIEAIVCSNNARGARANIVIYDESRIMNNEIIKSVIQPFLTKADRGQLWKDNPKWKKYALEEHNSEIYLTSIGYKDEWSYTDFLKYANFISDGEDGYAIMSLPYQFGIEAGIIKDSYVEKVVKDNSSDLKTIRMEMEVIPYGESEFSMFKYNELNMARKLRVPLVPITDSEYISCDHDKTKYKGYQPKNNIEVRVISMDIAVAAGRTNDNTVFTVFRLTPNGDYYEKELAYIEVLNGVNMEPQILRLKQLFYDLECDYCVIDANGIGTLFVHECGKITKDLVRNTKYDAWKTVNHVEKFDERVYVPDAKPVIYPIQVSGAGSSAMQYNMLMTAKFEFEKKRIIIPVSEDDIIDDINVRYKYMNLKTSNDYNDREKAEVIMNPFTYSSMLVKEAVTTQMIRKPSGSYTFDEKGGRKDIVISMMYGLYYINLLEADLAYSNTVIDVKRYSSSTNNTNTNRTINPFSNNLSKLFNFGGKR